MLDGDAILRLHLHRRIPHRLFRIAATDIGNAWWNAGGAADSLGVGDMLLFVVRNFYESRGESGLLVRFGHDERHRLVVEEDAIRLQRAKRLVLFPLSS